MENTKTDMDPAKGEPAKGGPPRREPEKPTDRSIFLWPGKAPGSDVDDGFRPWLEPFPLQTDAPRGAVLVCPGGGYQNRAPHECSPIARRFNEAGFHAFVVHYRVAPHRHPAPMLDASRALRIIRSRAPEWKVDAQRVAVCGFSAGGHLTGTLGVHFDNGDPGASDPLDRISNRPSALILCYAVISSLAFPHKGSFRNLLGEDAPEELVQYMCLDQNVKDNTPPVFLWHTANDASVPVENCLMFAQALRRRQIPFELHVYPDGRHGLALAADHPHVATWMGLCCQWLRGMGW